MKFIHLPDGRVAQVDDNVSVEDAYTYAGFPIPSTRPAYGPEGAGYKDTLWDQAARFAGHAIQSGGAALAGEAPKVVDAVQTALSMGPAAGSGGMVSSAVNAVAPQVSEWATGALQTAAQNAGRGMQDYGFGVEQLHPQTGSSTYEEALKNGDFGHYARNMIGDTAMYAGEVMGASLLGGPLAAYGIVSAQNTGDILEQQAQQGISDPDRAAAMGAATALPDVALGIGGRFSGMVDRAVGEGFWKGVGRTAVEEAITEPAQQLGQRYGAHQDLWSPEALQEYKEAAVVGGALGGLFGMIPGRHGQQPHPVDDQPGQPTDLMNTQLALPAPSRLPAVAGPDFTLRGGPTTPGGGGGGPQLALPAPEQTPLLEASSPFARAAPGTQMGLPLQGGVSNQQMQLPMNIPERVPPGQQQLPMNLPQAEAPVAPSTWREPELPMGQGVAPPPPGPLFRPPERAAPAPVPEPTQLELPGVPPTLLHHPDVARAMIGSRDRPVQSAKWLDALSDRVTGLAQAGDLRGIASEIDMRRQEVEDASNRSKNPISPATTKWRMEALDRADNWLTHLQNAPPEAAPRAPVETRAPEQLPLPFGSTPQPETQLGLPMHLPERPGMAATMPTMRGVGEAAAGPRTRLPEIEAWRQHELPFERGYRPPTPRGEAGPLFEEPPPSPAPTRGGGGGERQLSLMTRREMEAPARAKRAAAREAGRQVRERIARERAERKAARDVKAAEAEAARHKKTAATADAARKTAEAEAARLRKEAEAAPAPATAAPEPAPVPPPTATPTPRPVVEAKAPARKVNALRKQVAAAKEEADARDRSAPLRAAAIELRDEGVLDDAEFKEFVKTQRDTADHDALAKILTDHIDRWAGEARAAPEAAPKEEAAAPVNISPAPAAVAEATETVAPSGPVEEAIAERADKPKVARVPFAEVRRFINDVLPTDAARLTEGQIGTITVEGAREKPDFDKLRAYGEKKFAGPKAAAWGRIVDAVEKLQQARTQKTEARAPVKRSGDTRVPKKVEQGLDYIKELGATVLQRGAVFLRGDNIDSATAYSNSGQRTKARMRVIRLRQDRNHFASTMRLGTAQAQRLNSGVEAYLSETPTTNGDAWTNHGWNLGHLYQYGFVMPRADPDAVTSPAPVDREAISAKLATHFDMVERMQVASGINAASAGLAIPTTPGARDGAAWYYERSLRNRYFLDAKAQAEEAAARARAEREQADADKAAGALPKRGRGRPRKDGLGPGGLAMRLDLNEKQAGDYTRRGFLQGISAAALVSVAKPVIAKPSVPTSTAKHPELVRLLEGGKPKEALHWIASNSGSKQYRWIAKALLKGPGGFDSLTMRIDPYLADTQSAAGLTTVKDGRTEVSLDTKRGVDEDTFLHEMIHVYLLERWGLLNAYLPNNKRLLGDDVDRGDATVKEFQDLWQSIQRGMVKNLNLDTDEGLKNAGLGVEQFTGSIDEALSWALIDPKLESYLRSVDTNGDPVGDGKSAWRSIVNWFLKALGLDPMADPKLVTAFDALMSSSNNLFVAGAKVKPDLSFYTALDKAVEKQNSEQSHKLLETLTPEGAQTNMAGLAMMISENGARAQSGGYANIERAKALEASNIEPHFGSAIKHQTGWYKTHADGPWLMEITDHNMAIMQPQRMKEGHAGITTLGRLISYPQLFTGYPDLKDLRVVFDPHSQYAGAYMRMLNRSAPMSDPAMNAKNEIVISTAPGGVGHYGFKSVLLHETQHAVQDLEGMLIQRNAEGRATRTPRLSDIIGRGSPVLQRMNELAEDMRDYGNETVEQNGVKLTNALDYLRTTINEAVQLGKEGDLTGALARQAAVDDFANDNPSIKAALYEVDWTEMQARQTQQRMDLTEDQRSRANPNRIPVFGLHAPAREIASSYSELGPLGKALYLKGAYPVPNSEADPETTQMSDTLGKIAGSKELTPEQRDLAGQLGPLVEGMELRSGTGELGDAQRGQVTINKDGTVDAQVGHHDDSEAVLHEALHSAIVRRWGDLKAKMKSGDKTVDDIVNRLDKLRTAAAKLYDAKRDPAEVGEATANIDEFLAYGRTSPAVQDWLRTKQSGGLWGGFVDTVRRVLGLSPKYGPMLNAMMRESNSLLDVAARTEPMSAASLAEKVKSGDPVTLMLKSGPAKARVGANPIHELNEMSEPWVKGFGNLAKTRMPSYFAIRGDLYDMLARRMEQAGISSDPIKKLARVIASRDAIRVRGEQEVAQLNRDYLHLPEDERRGVTKDKRGKVNSLIEAMTRAGEWGFTPDWLPAADVARAKVNPDFAKRFNELSPAGQKHTKALLRSIYDKTQQLRATATEVVRNAYAPDLAAAKTDIERQAVENKIASETKQVLDPANFDNSLPYAPLRRSGEWAVAAMSKEYAAAKQAGNTKRMAELRGDHLHYFVDFAQTEAEAEHMRRAITKANPAFAAENGGIATRKEAKGMNEQFYAGGDMPQAFERVMSRISGSEEMKANTRTQLLNIARQLYLRSLSDQNARKGALRRFNVASMPLDIQLNVEQHLKSQSYNLASIQRNGDILDSFTALENSLEKLAPKPDDYAATSSMLKEITTRYMLSQQPPPEGPMSRHLEKLRGLSSFWQLSLSPRFLLQQTLQPTIMTAPLLEGRYGLKRGAAALANAYKAINMGALTKAWRDDTGLHTPNLVDKKYHALLNYIADMGLLDVGISAETGKLPNRLDEKLKGVRLAREWPRYIEYLNRASSAIATYEMEVQTPTEVSKPDAGAYADYRANVEGPAMTERQFNAAYAAARIVQQTQGDYSTASAPRFLQGPVGATLGQYRKIAIIVASNYIRMASRVADKSLSKTERAIAARSLAYSLGHVLAFGGMTGLPGATLMFGLVNMVRGWFGDDDDEPPDTEEDIRKAVGDPMLANLLLAGVPTMANLNLSNTLGQGQTFSLQPYQDLSLKRDDLLKYIGSLAGPAAGLGVSAAGGVQEMIDGNYYKGTAMMLPSGMSSMVSAFGEAQNGITNKYGTTLLHADDIDMFETAMRAAGFQTETRTGRFERGDRAYDVRQFYNDRQRDIMREYKDARQAGDAVSAQEAQDKWMRLQKVKKENGFKVTPLSSLLKSPARQAKEEAAAVGGVGYRRGETEFAKQQAALYADTKSPAVDTTSNDDEE